MNIELPTDIFSLIRDGVHAELQMPSDFLTAPACAN